MKEKNFSIITEFEKVFQTLNKEFFKGQINPVQFKVDIKSKNPLKWKTKSDIINIGPCFLNLNFSEIIPILLHEMIHISNFQKDKIDVTANQYHNKDFLKLALEIGFFVIKNKTQGWSITCTTLPRNIVEKVFVKIPSHESNQKLLNIINSIKLKEELFNEWRVLIKTKLKTNKPTKTFFLKYQCKCPPPYNSIRSGRRPDSPNAPNVECRECKAVFECVSKIDNK